MNKNSRPFDRLCGHGDIREIANITGFNVSYVRKVLDNQRTNNMIVDIANDLITMRSRIRSKYKALIGERGKEKSFSKIRDVENLLVDMQFRPSRRLMDRALQRLDADAPLRQEAIIRAREELSLYDRQILDSLDWLSTQRIQVEAKPTSFAIWPVLKHAVIFLEQMHRAAELRLSIENESTAIYADPYLTGTLVRALTNHMMRITAPQGEVHLYSTSTNKEVCLHIESSHCLLSQHSFDMLNDRKAIKATRPQADNFEAVAVVAHFVMELHDGWIEWATGHDNKATVKLIFGQGE